MAEKSRFDLYKTTNKGVHPREIGVIPNPEEWELERPISGSTRGEPTAENIMLWGAHPLTGEGITLEINHKLGLDSEVKLLYQALDHSVYRVTENSHPERTISGNVYHFPGISFEILQPSKRYRIVVRSYMTKVDQNGDQSSEPIFVRMRIIMYAVSNVYDALRESVAPKNESRDNRWEQFVQLKGKVQIENCPEAKLFLWGSRRKRIIDAKTSNRKLVQLAGFNEYGYVFSLTSHYDGQDGKFLYTDGCVSDSLHIRPVKNMMNSKIDFEKVQHSGWVGIMNLSRKLEAIVDHAEHGREGQTPFLSMTFKDSKGYACLFSSCSPSTAKKINIPPKMIQSSKMVVQLDDESALDQSMTGGKGFSLAHLRRQSNLKNDLSFVVPNGVVVTSCGYDAFLQENPIIKLAIKDLERNTWKNGQTSEEECQKVVDIVQRANISLMLTDMIKNELELIFGTNLSDRRFAVRSSGCDFEDSGEMSAAGQMETFLGVKTQEGNVNSIIDSVKSCWASQFTHIAVEYKRGYGLPLGGRMAVVIQEMVPDVKSAGVMFTCDPLTGDERIITISGNFGLGESVVSASAEPDSIRVSVSIGQSHSDPRKVGKIEENVLGSKSEKIIMSDSGTQTVKTDCESVCCLTDDEILNIARVGLQIANLTPETGPRDLEWAIDTSSQIYLLQSRPITSLDSQWSSFEIAHELDSQNDSPSELWCMINVAEVLIEPMTPLGWDTIDAMSRPYFFESPPIGGITLDNSPYKALGMFSLRNTTAMNITNGRMGISPDRTTMSNALEKSVLGMTLDEPHFIRTAKARLPKNSFMDHVRAGCKAISLLNVSKDPRKICEPEAQRMEEMVAAVRESNDPATILEIIFNGILPAELMFREHIIRSFSSSISNIILLALLAGGNGNGSSDEEKDEALMTRLSQMLSNVSGVVSAECPDAMTQIANAIESKEEFLKMDPKQRLACLQYGSSKSAQLFRNFIDRHGHRGSMELDLGYPCWADDAQQIVDSLSMILQNEQTGSDLINKEKTADPLDSYDISLFKKKYIQWIARPKGHQRIRDREWTKWYAVKSINYFRLAFRHLAHVLSREQGKIPDPELMKQFTLAELDELINNPNPNPGLIAKVKLRDRNFRSLHGNRYPIFTFGPDFLTLEELEAMQSQNDSTQPIQNNNTIPNNTIPNGGISTDGMITLTGTPVYAGKVKGRAFVAKTLADVTCQKVKLQRGDILITKGTDIAWSPVFPLLSGIVTENGGLVSHGAVIAREYALPCLIGVKKATDTFQTGQQVELDSSSNKITLLSDS